MVYRSAKITFEDYVRGIQRLRPEEQLMIS